MTSVLCCMVINVNEGVLEHGKGVTYYTNFSNISKGANLSIYCILRQLNLWKQRHGHNPEEIYIQVDFSL